MGEKDILKELKKNNNVLDDLKFKLNQTKTAIDTLETKNDNLYLDLAELRIKQ